MNKTWSIACVVGGALSVSYCAAPVENSGPFDEVTSFQVSDTTPITEPDIEPPVQYEVIQEPHRVECAYRRRVSMGRCDLRMNSGFILSLAKAALLLDPELFDPPTSQLLQPNILQTEISEDFEIEGLNGAVTIAIIIWDGRGSSVSYLDYEVRAKTTPDEFTHFPTLSEQVCSVAAARVESSASMFKTFQNIAELLRKSCKEQRGSGGSPFGYIRTIDGI